MTDNDHDDDIVTRLRWLAEELFDDPDAAKGADEIERLRYENQRLRAEADEIAYWIVDQFLYPIKCGTDQPPSEPWRRRIEDAWVVMSGDADHPDYDEDIRIMVGVEGGWLK